MQRNNTQKLGLNNGFHDGHDEEREYREKITPYLLRQAYHLPGNSWIQDWYQFMANNHPLFGICLATKYHPVGRCVRLISLVGSILFGVAVTNIIFLVFVFYDQDFDKTYMEVTASDTALALGVEDLNIDENVEKAAALAVTNGNLVLWTVGAGLHTVYDSIVWTLATCSCCASGIGITAYSMERFRASGVWLVMFLVIIITAVATFAVAIRSAVMEYQEANNHAKELGLSQADVLALKDKVAVQEYEFFIAYAIELVLNFFVFYPIVGTILFSGCLTCGKTKFLGGRPYEIEEEENGEEELESNEFKEASIPKRKERPRRGTTSGRGGLEEGNPPRRGPRKSETQQKPLAVPKAHGQQHVGYNRSHHQPSAGAPQQQLRSQIQRGGPNNSGRQQKPVTGPPKAHGQQHVGYNRSNHHPSAGAPQQQHRSQMHHPGGVRHVQGNQNRNTYQVPHQNASRARAHPGEGGNFAGGFSQSHPRGTFG